MVALNLAGPLGGQQDGQDVFGLRRRPRAKSAAPRGPLSPMPPLAPGEFDAAFDGAPEPSAWRVPPAIVANEERGLGPLGGTTAESLGGPLPDVKKQGPLGRVGAFFGSDEGKAALFRAGATMLAGGNVGEGMLAGAGEVDRRKKEAVDAAHYDREMGQKDRGFDISQQGTDQTGLYQAGMLEDRGKQRIIDLLELQEAVRKNRTGEALTMREQDLVNNYNNQKIGLGHTEEDGRNSRNNADNAQSNTNNVRTTAASVYGTDVGSEDRKYTANLGFYGAGSPESSTTSKTTDDDGKEVSVTTKRPGARPPISGTVLTK